MTTPCYIFDVEGTLSDHTHRLHLVPGKLTGEQSDWKAFQDEFINDPPNMIPVEICRILHRKASIVISTGLHRNYYRQLMTWLDMFLIPVEGVYMREARHGQISSPKLKELHYMDMLRAGYTPLAIFDDRLDVCETMKELGIETFHLPFQGFKMPGGELNES